MRVAIVGSRRHSSEAIVSAFVKRLAEKHPDAVVVSGGCEGVDRWAEGAAQRNGLVWESYRPYEMSAGGFGIRLVKRISATSLFCSSTPLTRKGYASYGKAAFARNGLIVAGADEVVAFWDGRSRGTRNSMDIAAAAGVRVWRR